MTGKRHENREPIHTHVRAVVGGIAVEELAADTPKHSLHSVCRSNVTNILSQRQSLLSETLRCSKYELE